MTQPRKRPAQQRSRATVDVILEAAAQVFDTEGIAATTNRIAERAGVSIGSVYQYFPDKHALLHELALRHLAVAAAEIDAVLSRAETTDAHVVGLVEDLTRAIVRVNQSPGQLHQVLRGFAPRSPELLALFGATASRVVTAVADRLRELGVDDPVGRARLAYESLDGQAHGSLGRIDDPDRREARIRAVVAGQLSVLGLTPTSADAETLR
ncbi:TetR/AcrR family transcriptional regulator [Aeromicrobium sp. Sec7.5]|uniref:TetR/AcrR family transcriptional regulator n=1 Tax=Aeromicrobium sp. Sec7.5 TaxID=3121276 RepID=UPI002FE44D98